MMNFITLAILSAVFAGIGIAIWKFGKVNVLRDYFTAGVDVTEEYKEKLGKLFILLGIISLICGGISLIEGVAEFIWFGLYILGFVFVMYRINLLKKANLSKGNKRRKKK